MRKRRSPLQPHSSRSHHPVTVPFLSLHVSLAVTVPEWGAAPAPAHPVRRLLPGAFASFAWPWLYIFVFPLLQPSSPAFFFIADVSAPSYITTRPHPMFPPDRFPASYPSSLAPVSLTTVPILR
ncbi:hypothetical protein BJV78DRAFT_422127 [Lactifluus subvellereus]|nr:hypothetical protein BJV78DRAFT_422127 [Lactifluus subvellereus]